MTADAAAGAEHAREVAGRAKRMITDLLAKNRALTEEVQAIRVRPLPPLDDPGWRTCATRAWSGWRCEPRA